MPSTCDSTHPLVTNPSLPYLHIQPRLFTPWAWPFCRLSISFFVPSWELRCIFGCRCRLKLLINQALYHFHQFQSNPSLEQAARSYRSTLHASPSLPSQSVPFTPVISIPVPSLLSKSYLLPGIPITPNPAHPHSIPTSFPLYNCQRKDPHTLKSAPITLKITIAKAEMTMLQIILLASVHNIHNLVSFLPFPSPSLSLRSSHSKGEAKTNGIGTR